jgi:general secretion pathway protein G
LSNIHPLKRAEENMQRMKASAGVRASLAGNRRGGFTLIEIMVVIVVIAIIAAMVAPNIFKNVNEAKLTAAKAQMSTISGALELYMLDNHRFPTSEQGLGALWEVPVNDPPRNWKGPYLKKRVPLDPWGNPYGYISPGEANPGTYDLYSLGADGEVGGEGENADILEWESGG